MADSDRTQILLGANLADLIAAERVHCLELSNGAEITKRYVVKAEGLRFGRAPPAEVILPDPEVSRAHCMVMLQGNDLVVTDLDSTNGTFVDGVKVEGMQPLPIGSALQLGSHVLKHEWRSQEEIAQSTEFTRELERAASYVAALLPAPVDHGPVRAEWVYEPSAQLGGDAFGYGQLDDDLFVGYLVDVAGHGAGAAMHAVSIMNQLRQRSLPNVDLTRPAQVLSALNKIYQMDDHAGLYFTIWYGVYNTRTRRLDYASGGHHAAYLVPPGKGTAVPLRTRNVMIGGMPGMTYREDSVIVPPGSTCYMFSDGVYEIIDKSGLQWTIDDFVDLMLQPGKPGCAPGQGEAKRLHQAVKKCAQPETLDDDYSLVVMTFD